MKKTILPLIALLFALVSQGQTYNITFRVDMNNVTENFTTPEVNGTFNNWCGGCAPMSDANGDGIWELTIPLQAGNYEYKFAADNWNPQEQLVPGSPCTVTNFGFTNRSLVVSADAVLDAVCWGSCASCALTDGPYDVTFQVNMNDVTVPFNTPEVNGEFNNWCGACAPMSDEDGDGIWEITISLNPGMYEYKFSVDGWTIQEELTPGIPCTMTTELFTNRVFTVSEDIVLDPVCWGSCTNCGVVAATYDVTFQVDMSNVTDAYTTPEVNGQFNDWCGGCAPMSDEDGDGIYELTITLEEGTYEYKFAADAWALIEPLMEGDVCTINGAPFVNRVITVDSDVTLPAVCWGSCSPCETEPVETGIINLTFDEAASITAWAPVADATLPEASIVWNNAGVTTGAMEISGSNSSAGIGRAYIFQYVDGNVDYEGNTAVQLSFDVKLSAPLNGAALHLQTELASTGTINTFDIQNAGVNADTWTTLTYDYENIGAGTLFRIHFNIAAGAFVGAGGTILIDNIRVVGLGDAVSGCTDEAANNYNPEATTDDGSCLYDVTFHVNMNEVTQAFSTPNLNGTFNNWCGACAPMSDEDGDGIWSITIELAQGNYEYKFSADGWSIDETLVSGSACTVTNNGFTNRSLTVSGAEERPVVCWGSCNDCGFVVQTYNVTFRVDMSQVTEAYTTPEVNGTFNNWCGGCAPMSDADGDDIWELVIPLEAGNYEFKYAADNWGIQEELTPGSTCTITVGTFTNRVLTVSEDMVMDVVCWGACQACENVVEPVNVTFIVDMSQVTETFTTPEVNGTFNGFCGNCAPMSDANSDGIWELTIPLTPGTYEYIFSADNFEIQETLTPGSTCTLTTGEFTNRVIVVEAATVLPEVCWASCVACPNNVNENDLSQAISVYPNPANDMLFVNNTISNENAIVRMFDISGKLVFENQNFNAVNSTINTSELNNGIYTLQFVVKGGVFNTKVAIRH
jgi:1,4-alpha-glucan branching enzyme